MSNEALTAVAKANIRPSGRKFVLMALADYADEQWSCFPSVAQLAAYTSQGKRTVRDHLDALDRDKIITRTRHRREDGTLGRYRFVIQRQKLPVAEIATGEKHPKPAADFRAHNPQENPHKSSLRSDKRTPRAVLEEVLDKERAAAVIDHRQKMRRPLTAHAAKLLAQKFACCPDPNAAADVMIGAGWQGFEPAWMKRIAASASQSQPDTPPGRERTVIDALSEFASGTWTPPKEPCDDTHIIETSFETSVSRGDC